MRAYLPAYEMRRPRDLGEALAWLGERPREWRPFAGGTDLMVLLEAGKLRERKFVSLWGLRELQGIRVEAGEVILGALTTYSEIRGHPVLAAEFPMLGRAAAETGAIAIQNRGTLGGNIANASPAADSPPALLAYGAELELRSLAGTRRVSYDRFHLGYKKVDLQPGEIISRIILPRRPAEKDREVHHYRKVGTRKAQAISKVCFAGWARMEGGRVAEARISLGSVAPVPTRCPRTEATIAGKAPQFSLAQAAVASLEAELAPIDDLRSSAEYRRRVAGRLLEEFLELLK